MTEERAAQIAEILTNYREIQNSGDWEAIAHANNVLRSFGYGPPAIAAKPKDKQ